MGILKVVSVWYGCWYECGLIIWGFNRLEIIALIFVCFYCSFFTGLAKFGFYCKLLDLININRLSHILH